MRRRQGDRLRDMYVGGRGNATARRYARFWNAAFRLGLLPRRWVTLEVRGRRSGRLTHIPVDRHEPVEAFTAIAANYPVFQVVPL